MTVVTKLITMWRLQTLLVVLALPALVGSEARAQDLPAPLVVLSHRYEQRSLPSYGFDRELYQTPIAAAAEQRARAASTSRYPVAYGNLYPRKMFRYEVVIKNVGARRVREVEWVYAFVDARDPRYTTRHYFRHKVKIKPAGEKKLEHYSRVLPTRTVDARQPLEERVTITRVRYADGSWWANPLAP